MSYFIMLAVIRVSVYFCNDKCASCAEEHWTERMQAVRRPIFT